MINRLIQRMQPFQGGGLVFGLYGLGVQPKKGIVYGLAGWCSGAEMFADDRVHRVAALG